MSIALRVRVVASFTIHVVVFVCVFAAAAGLLHAQPFNAGETYFGRDRFIEYQAGNMPLIISVPHGGNLAPDSIPDRNCDGCTYVQDAYTQELARAIREAFVQRTGCYPHVVHNLLHRKKLDMNRDSTEATDSNSAMTPYWTEYQRFIDSAKSAVAKQFGKGLFIDLHGHGHAKARIEFGYLLYGSQLRETDSLMNTAKRIAVSSIRNLVAGNRQGISHSALVRGDSALGTLFADRGYPGVPSKQDPFPLSGDDYFNGGFNTLMHGSSIGGTVDAIQMELNSAPRFSAAGRSAFADTFVTAVLSYLEYHYIENFASHKCTTTGVEVGDEESIFWHPNVLRNIPPNAYSNVYSNVYPNPTADVFRVDAKYHNAPYELYYELFDATGQIMSTGQLSNTAVDVSVYNPGVYMLRIYTGATVHTLRIVKI